MICPLSFRYALKVSDLPFKFPFCSGARRKLKGHTSVQLFHLVLFKEHFNQVRLEELILDQFLVCAIL